MASGQGLVCLLGEQASTHDLDRRALEGLVFDLCVLHARSLPTCTNTNQSCEQR
jgi:hypothetical protein